MAVFIGGRSRSLRVSMTYSEVLITYHRINLSKSSSFAVDLHFTGAASHLQLWRKARAGSRHEAFHNERFLAHQKALMLVVFTGGDFSVAVDPTGFELHKRGTWSSGYILEKDPLMFNSFPYDLKLVVGEEHPNVVYLSNIAA